MAAGGRRGVIPVDVEAIRRRIEHWRRRRSKRTAMPEELWAAAVAAARAHGLWAVSRWLSVNYESLKKRLRSGGGRRGDHAAVLPAGFVELEPIMSPGLGERRVGAGMVVELVGSDGAKLVVQFQCSGPEALDMRALVDAFWRRGT